jgi:hypothetical protein
MELAAIKAFIYMKRVRQDKVDEHRHLHSQEGPCSGLTYSEWKLPVRQKKTFSKSKRFACNRLWNHRSVPTSQGIESLTIKTI